MKEDEAPAAPAGHAKVSPGGSCLHLSQYQMLLTGLQQSCRVSLSLSVMLLLQIKAVSQSSTAQPTPAPVKEEDMAAEPNSSAGAVKQDDQVHNTEASSSMSRKHAGAEMKKEQEEKQDEVGSKRLSGGSPEKTPTKKPKKSEGSMDGSPAARQTKGPMDSFVIKNPA